MYNLYIIIKRNDMSIENQFRPSPTHEDNENQKRREDEASTLAAMEKAAAEETDSHRAEAEVPDADLGTEEGIDAALSALFGDEDAVPADEK
jgi:hypothetical protein